jgi:hypothetical protein
MNENQIIGLLLQDLRDNRQPDEEDLSLPLCRETSKIFDLIVNHGYLTRNMFDTTDIGDDCDVDERYAQYRTTNYPITYVAFANQFSEWLLGDDKKERVDLLDLILMIKEFSWLRIKIVSRPSGFLVVVRNTKYSEFTFEERAFISH